MYKNTFTIIFITLISFHSFSKVSNDSASSFVSEKKISPSQDIDSFADSVSISGNRALVGGK